MNKQFKVPVWLIIYIICILIYIYFIIFNGEVLLCDSNESINDFVVEKNQSSDSHSTHPLPDFFSKFKRKVSWYINGKKSGQFSSYSEYKDYWNSSIERDSLWKIIKDDLRKTCYNTSKYRAKSFEESNRLMTDIRNERINRNILDQQRRNIVNNR